MSNLINNLIKSAQEIVINAACPLGASSHSDEEKKKFLKDAAKRINLLFEKNCEIVRVSKDLSLEDQAVEYVKNHPILKPFFSQIFPKVQFPKITQIFVENGPSAGEQQEVQIFNTICSAQSAFEETKQQCLAQQNEPFLSQLKTRIMPIFEGNSSFSPPQGQGADYPEYLSPFISQWSAMIFDQQLEELENKYNKLNNIDADSIKDKAAKIAFIVDVFPHTFDLLLNQSNSMRNLPFRQELLTEVLSIIGRQDTKKLSALIRNCGLNEQQRFEIVKIAAAQYGLGVSMYIQGYGLNEQQRFEVAKIAAAQYGLGVSMYIQDYRLNEQQRFEVAKIAAAQYGLGVSMYIQDYRLNEQQRFEVAKIVAAQYARGASMYIQGYGLNEQQRFEVAKIAAAQDGEEVSEYIQGYGLDESQRFEVAKIAAAQHGSGVSKKIQNYALKSSKQLFHVFTIAFLQDPEVFTLFSNYKSLLEENALYELFTLLAGDDVDTLQVAQKLLVFAKNKQWNIAPLIEQVRKLKNIKLQKESLIWLTHLLTASSLENFSGNFNALFIDTGFMQSAFSLHSPSLRYRLTLAMLQYAQSGPDQRFAGKSLGECNRRVYAYEKLPILMISLLFSQGISESTCRKLLEISHNNQLKKDEAHLRKWLEPMDKITQESRLSSEDKEHLFLKLIDQSTITVVGKGNKTKSQIDLSLFLENLSFASTILDLKKAEVLKRDTLKDNDLSAILQDLFTSYLPIKPFKNFADLYQHYFTQARIPHYILTYLAKIESAASQEKKGLIDALVCCVEAILSGNLPECRYDLEKSVHLKTVFSGREALFEMWKKGESCSLLNSLKVQESQKYDGWILADTDDGQDLFLSGTEVGSCQKITGNPRSNKCLINYVLDGKNRLLAIKDSLGKIKARHIFRVLWDGEQPVLFLENLYPNVVDPELQNALLEFARRRAQAMGLPLLYKNGGKIGSAYMRQIESLGSRAPFEYSDSSVEGGGNGVIAGGRFKILNSFSI